MHEQNNPYKEEFRRKYRLPLSADGLLVDFAVLLELWRRRKANRLARELLSGAFNREELEGLIKARRQAGIGQKTWKCVVS